VHSKFRAQPLYLLMGGVVFHFNDLNCLGDPFHNDAGTQPTEACATQYSDGKRGCSFEVSIGVIADTYSRRLSIISYFRRGRRKSGATVPACFTDQYSEGFHRYAGGRCAGKFTDLAADPAGQPVLGWAWRLPDQCHAGKRLQPHPKRGTESSTGDGRQIAQQHLIGPQASNCLVDLMPVKHGNGTTLINEEGSL
jgi:hypothetical protein